VIDEHSSRQGLKQFEHFVDQNLREINHKESLFKQEQQDYNNV